MVKPAKSNPLFHKLSLVTCGVVLGSPVAAGQEHATPSADVHLQRRFGSRSQVLVGVEGLARFLHDDLPTTHSSWTDSDGHEVRETSTGSTDSASLFAPRLGIDWFIVNHVSVGVGAQYSGGTLRGTSRTTSAAGSASSGSSSTIERVTLSPRIGVAFTSAAGFGVWARAEVEEGTTWSAYRANGGASGSLASLGGSQTSSQTYWSAGLTAGVEALGTYTPRDDLVLMAGPWLTQSIGTFHDSSSSLTPNAGEMPPAYGLTIGAGLVL